MAGITLEIAEARLTEYLDAEAKVLASQAYKIAGREQQRALLADIQNGIDLWNRRVQAFSRSASGRGRARTVVVGG